MQSLITSKSIYFVFGFTKRGKVESSQHDMLRSSPGEVSLTGLHSPLYTYTFLFPDCPQCSVRPFTNRLPPFSISLHSDGVN